MTNLAADAPVVFVEVPTPHGQVIGQAILNAPKSLNSLTLEMIRSLHQKIAQWKHRNDVVAIWLEGSGDKAFCAGGDIVQLYEAMKSGDFDLPDNFFEEEYSLDLSLHQLSKPLIVWGNGIVMGGGMGLMQGAKFRIVTERTMIAMPEITIGLYPDVGASYFLHKAPPALGLFEALTGARLNATDALTLRFADAFVESSRKQELLESLTLLGYSTDTARNTELVESAIAQIASASVDSQPASQLNAHRGWIEKTFSHASLAEMDAAIRAHITDDKWLARSLDAYKNGSPLSAALIFEQLQRSKTWSLEDAFAFELAMSARCARSGEFQEGVRALLIEKDGQPKWQKASAGDVTAQEISRYFAMPAGKTLRLSPMI